MMEGALENSGCNLTAHQQSVGSWSCRARAALRIPGDCLLGNGREGQEVKTSSRWGGCTAPTGPLSQEEPDLQGWPQASVWALDTLTASSQDVQAVLHSECLTQVGDHPSPAWTEKEENSVGLGEGGDGCYGVSQHCPYRRMKL